MESQNLEWKESWRDEYLKTICAFANTHGGLLEIGRNDKGVICGVSGLEKLMEDLPNKIKSAMAIIADVSACEENGKRYIVVSVNAHPFPISYRGSYYIRSGSTTQQLTGRLLRWLIKQRIWCISSILKVLLATKACNG